MSRNTDLTEIFSDESSFYGDESEQAQLEEKAATYDVEPYWSQYHPKLLSTIQNDLRAPTPNPPESDPDQDASKSGRLPSNKRGANESTNSFLSQLPPSNTVLSHKEPWIWARGKANLSATLKLRDEPTFIKKGTELLRAFEETLSELRAVHDKSGAKTTAALTRKLTALRRDLEQNILALARETGITAGKWMLFPSARNVDETWRTLVMALDSGDVRADAKVAADDGSQTDKSRLICVYTEDFSDKKDVKKVLGMLEGEGLYDPRKGPIYYKCDAYTLLDITSKNEYGLKASMYSSKDLKA
ncbi:hypothetical protein N7520_003833 [Penicillium odoratum]|uniref:uncharacterized protein n=1 Tax=Penicillium odoratum TaxID=1167516 RepID=UPI002548F398|nr:uncharacterized protein N7520_003833 [Penicillium odoratum]KAJ5769274.1 hypothetical protein N7520_003833 [Penicillium odoratum]